MWKKILPMGLVLVVVFSFTACAGEPSAQEIVDGVIESFDNIRTYQFDMDMTMDMSGKGEAFEVTIVMDSSGAVDVENKQMSMDATLSTRMGQRETEEVMAMYLIGDMMYTMMDSPEKGPRWTSEMPDRYWGDWIQVEFQIELLEAAQVDVIGSERVGGIDCYVLQVTPDLEQLWQKIGWWPAELLGHGEVPDVTEELLQEVFRSFSVKQWVAKDTYFLVKAEINMAMELTPEFMGWPEEEGVMAIDIAIVSLEYDYNQPVSIVLPPEAEEAIEVPVE